MDTGYGQFGNTAEVMNMEELFYEDQKAHVKKLWKEDPKNILNGKKDVLSLIFYLISLVLVIILFLLMSLNYNLCA